MLSEHLKVVRQDTVNGNKDYKDVVNGEGACKCSNCVRTSEFIQQLVNRVQGSLQTVLWNWRPWPVPGWRKLLQQGPYVMTAGFFSLPYFWKRVRTVLAKNFYDFARSNFWVLPPLIVIRWITYVGVQLRKIPTTLPLNVKDELVAKT